MRTDPNTGVTKRRGEEISSSKSGDGNTAAQPEAPAEFRVLSYQLSMCKPYCKEVESSIPGEPSFKVQRTLPSFFDSYPRCKRAVDLLAASSSWPAAINLLQIASNVLVTANTAPMERMISEVLSENPDLGTSEAAIEIEIAGGELEPAAQKFRWQVWFIIF